MLQVWTEPVPMDTGSPDPILVVEGVVLWVAYRARDLDFPGWGHPETDAYLERTPEGEPFGVIGAARSSATDLFLVGHDCPVSELCLKSTWKDLVRVARTRIDAE